MSKDEICTCKACKNTVFHCQICKFVRFLLPSSSWLLKLPIRIFNSRRTSGIWITYIYCYRKERNKKPEKHHEVRNEKGKLKDFLNWTVVILMQNSPCFYVFVFSFLFFFVRLLSNQYCLYVAEKKSHLY